MQTSLKRTALLTRIASQLTQVEDNQVADVIEEIHDMLYSALPSTEADYLWNKLNDLAESIH